jgi:hypothetical protein
MYEEAGEGVGGLRLAATNVAVANSSVPSAGDGKGSTQLGDARMRYDPSAHCRRPAHGGGGEFGRDRGHRAAQRRAPVLHSARLLSPVRLVALHVALPTKTPTTGPVVAGGNELALAQMLHRGGALARHARLAAGRQAPRRGPGGTTRSRLLAGRVRTSAAAICFAAPQSRPAILCAERAQLRRCRRRSRRRCQVGTRAGTA